MAKPKLDFVALRTVITRIAPAETDLSGAIASNAELMASIIRAQAPMNISPLATHGVVAALSGANADLVAGMTKTVAAHALLADLRDSIGLSDADYGGGMWKGDLTARPGDPGDAGNAQPVVALAASA